MIALNKTQNPKRYNIVAGVVSYNPILDDVYNHIDSIKDQAGQIFLIDVSVKTSALLEELTQRPGKLL